MKLVELSLYLGLIST